MTEPDTWATHDYVSEGLRRIELSHAFPHRRAHDHLRHPWRYLRRDVPHTWYADERHPAMGFLNVDEATLLHNVALRFAGRRALEIGSWLGWSTAHLAAAGLDLDVLDPAHHDPEVRASVETSLATAGLADRVHLTRGRSPDDLTLVAARTDEPWSLVFVDGDHEGAAPARDALACLPHVASSCAFVFHDLASPDVAAGLRALIAEGFEVLLYQTAQIMGIAWRGDVVPVRHVPDPTVAWQVPMHLLGLPISGADASPSPIVPRALAAIEALPGDSPRPSVCVVTNEVIGPFKNGGIGTSMTGLAETLASQGLAVTILYTGNIWTPDVSLDAWRARYAELGIELETLSFEALGQVAGPVRDRGFALPFVVHRWLLEHHFDVVHFNDCCGDGVLSLAAKALGLAFHDCLFVTALHSPSQWVLELNETLPTGLLLTAYAYAERLSIQCSDVLWSPSRYLLDWARDHGYELPVHTYVHQYSLPSPRVGGGPAAPTAFPEVRLGRVAPPREIVFFGRLEERKGLRLFCNAVHLLEEELSARGTTITFLGKPQMCGGVGALEYLARRSATWRFPVRIITDLGQPEAVAYLRGEDRLAVVASPADNSPCTIYEALAWGIPFLAAATGGIPELVHEDDHDDVLFSHSTSALRDALCRVLAHGGHVARPAVSQDDTRRGLASLHQRWDRLRPERSAPAPSRWAMAIVDHRRGNDLEMTMRSISACTWIRRVMVLDATGEATPSLPNATVIDLTREDPAALARLLRTADEDDVALVHSGVAVLPVEFARMLGALDHPAVDGLLPVAEVTDLAGRTRFAPPLGGSAAFSLFEGVTFTGAMVVPRKELTEVVDGCPLVVGSAFLGMTDAFVADGRSVWPYPETAVRWPSDLRFDVRSPRPDRVAAYARASSTERYYMLSAGLGSAPGVSSASRRREVAMVLVDLGLAPAVRVASSALRRARAARGRVAGTAVDRAVRRLRQR